jgi:flagellar hook protein FlgE
MADVLSIALGGLNAQQQKVARAADNIANLSTPGRDVDLAKEAVDLIIAKNAFKANVTTLKVEKEMQDSLLDVIA